MNFNKKYLFIFIPVFLILGWWVWSKFFTDATATPAYQTVQVEKGTLVVSVTAAGQVSTSNSRTVTTQASGVVKNVFTKNGELVETGEKIAEIEFDLESQQAYAQALSSYQSAKNALAVAQANQYSSQATMLGKWDTFKELAESDNYKDTNSTTRNLPEFVIPQSEWLAAEAQYKNQQSAITQAQTALSSSSQSLRLLSPIITAPIGGKISGLSLQKGTVITNSSEQSIANITTDALPTVTVNLTESDVTNVQIGDKAIVTLDAVSDTSFTGSIVSINTVGSVNSGVTSYEAIILLDTTSPIIFSNMSIQASIITETKDNTLIIPISAVKTQNGQSTVSTLKDNKTEVVSVETGSTSGTKIEILSGLEEGTTIITSTTTTGTPTTQTTSPFSGVGAFGGRIGR